MRDIHQDGGGFLALIVLAIIVLIVVVLLLILYADVQNLWADLYRFFHPFGSFYGSG